MRNPTFWIFVLAVGQLQAQLPPDAIDLGLVKISQVEKPIDLCPVHLVKSNPDLDFSFS